jgi:mannose-6-phosphate isomerase-like protein (cupin superfamily)
MERRGFVAGVFVGAALCVGAWSGRSLIAQATQPQVSSGKIVLENDRVRVKDVTFPPGGKPQGMHTHSLPHVGVIITGGMLHLRSPDGKVEKLDVQAGSVGYREANATHEAINMSSTPIRVIEVEVK